MFCTIEKMRDVMQIKFNTQPVAPAFKANLFNDTQKRFPDYMLKIRSKHLF